MKILILAASLVLLAGCNVPGQKNQGQNPPPQPPVATLSGTWAGNVSGTNFTGTITIDTNLTQTAGNVTGSVLAPTGNCPISAQLSGTISGDKFTLSSTAGTYTVFQGTLAGNQITGTVSFAAGPCGTQQNPWTGTFSEIRQ